MILRTTKGSALHQVRFRNAALAAPPSGPYPPGVLTRRRAKGMFRCCRRECKDSIGVNGKSPLPEKTLTSAELVAAFGRLREIWKDIFKEAPGPEARKELAGQVREDLDVVAAAARASVEAQPFIELTYLVRMDDWRIEGADLDRDLEEAAEGVRSGLEMRLRTLRQMESGDEVLSVAGRDIRRAVARDLVFFSELRKLARGESGEGEDKLAPDRLTQMYDPRRKLVREETQVPNPALEAVEFLVRLGAS